MMTSDDTIPKRYPIASAAGHFPEPYSILGVAIILLRNRRMVLGIMMLVAAVAVGRAVIAPRLYSSSASFIPAGRKAGSPLSGLVAQFGVSVPSGDPQESPDFYAALLHTRAVQDEVVDASYTFVGATGPYSGTLLDYYGGKGTPLPRRRIAALRTLDDQITSGTSLRTGVVTLTVRSFSPTLSAGIARNLLSALDRFNRARAQVQSLQERQFAEEQVDAAASDLRAAENRLETFQEQNRDYTSAPRLAFEHQRLLREVGMRQQLYSSLALAYAQTRMDAVRDKPAVAILEPPAVPPDPEPRGLAKTGVLALLAGLFLGVFLAFVREHVVRTRHARPEEDAEFAALRAATRHDLRNPLRLLLARWRK